jgi:hypothetical protein
MIEMRAATPPPPVHARGLSKHTRRAALYLIATCTLSREQLREKLHAALEISIRS